MFRQILSNNELTDAVGNPLEVERDQMFGIRKVLDKCLSSKQCEGEKLDCWLEVGEKSERGIVRKKIIKFCDLRWNGEPILIPQG